jgi:hypothetical protein
MWKRRSALKLLVAEPSARRRRSRLKRRGTGGWIPGRKSPVRATTIRHSERSRPGETSPNERRLDTAVLEQDSTAFVEALEVPTSGTRRPGRKREAAGARLRLVRLMAEADARADDLEAAKRARDAGDYSRLSTMRRLRFGRRPVALEKEVEAAQRRLTRKHEEVQTKRTRTEALERDAQESSGRGHGATVYRLHSADHHLSCSSGQYEHLSGVQRANPVWLTANNGLRWWWYRDRFWWVDSRLSAPEIESMILTRDLASEGQREAFERAQAGLVGDDDAAWAQVDLPDHVRREVWFRDRGRCVDCGVATSLAFDHVLPLAVGGSNTAPNLELRCRPCQLRRRANEVRATIGKARIGAHAAKEWGVELKDVSWPRPS